MTKMMMSDDEIVERCVGDRGMIKPFVREHVSRSMGEGVISFGLSSYGYDARVDETFRMFQDHSQEVIDPKAFNEDIVIEKKATNGYILIPPHSFVLGTTVEEFDIPRDILGLCFGKSTYRRCGIVIDVTPLEPKWRGRLTLEISNTAPLPVKVYTGEGLIQLVFLKASHVCSQSYADRKGKYQDQKGIEGPKV